MEQFTITLEEKEFILKRRELAAKRKNLQQPAPKDAVLGENRPKGWDTHCELSKPHAGRVTDSHPLYKFEEEVFKKLGNLEHKEQHKLFRKLFNAPVQNVFRDRSYHILSHMDALWDQELLPICYKRWYEEIKTKNGIDDTNVHPEHKKLKPDYTFPVITNKREWNPEKYGDHAEEEFVAGKKYRYAYDNETGYSYKEAYKDVI